MYIYTHTYAICNTKGNELINSDNVQDMYAGKYAGERSQRADAF